LASLASGACTSEQLIPLVNAELAHLGVTRCTDMAPPEISEMLAEFQQLVARYDSLGVGESLDLLFE
jgi:hypothetical protein